MMFPVLHSIDNLLNRFDQLSQQHTSFKSSFEKTFSDIDNPLRDVRRNEREQKKTNDSLIASIVKKDERLPLLGSVEEFNRRIVKSRYQHRPPSYCSNDTNSLLSRTPSRTSLDSIPPLYTSTLSLIPTTITTNTHQSMASSTLFENRKKQKIHLSAETSTKTLPKISSTPRPRARNPITVFSMETVNRLAKPKTYHLLPDQVVPIKRAHRRTKSYQNTVKEVPRSRFSSIKLPPLLPPPPPPPSTTPVIPQIKRTNPPTIKPPSKKMKIDTSFSSDTLKKLPKINPSRSAIPLTLPPAICLSFPMQSELNPSRVVIILKTVAPKKPLNVFTNRKSIIPFHRMKYLMT